MRYSRLLLLAALAPLGACGGATQTTVEEAGPNGLPYGAVGLLATKARLESLAGTDYTAKGTLGEYDTTGFTATKGTTTATLRMIDDDTLRVKLDGVTYTLTSANGGATFTAGEVTAIPAYSGSSGGTDSVVFYRVIDETGTDLFSAHLVTGFETKTSEFPSTGTYTGGAGMEIFNSAGNQVTVFDDPGNLLLTGDNGDNGQLSLTVNFGTGAVGGNITADNSLGGENLDLVVTGTVSGAGFSGTFIENPADDHSTLDFADTAITGGFYGPAARDVAGAISATVSGAAVTDGTNSAVGFFVGAR